MATKLPIMISGTQLRSKHVENENESDENNFEATIAIEEIAID